MFYYLYQITNNLNGKIYVGVHKTKDMNDGYMGSGKVIRSAIEKYGIENFTKVILEQFEDASAMYAREKEVVDDEFLLREDTYNLRRGGTGGFDYINSSGKNLRTGCVLCDSSIEKMRDSIRKNPQEFDAARRLQISENNPMKNPETVEKMRRTVTGLNKSEEHKRKISEAVKARHMARRAGIIQG